MRISCALFALTVLLPARADAQVMDRRVVSERLSTGRAVLHRAGEVFVLDQAPEILVFDESGEYRRTIGRRGRGPGEFENAGRAGWQGDTMWVYDVILRRVSYFSGDTFVRSIPVTPAGDSFEGLLADGSMLIAGNDDWHRISTGAQSAVSVQRRPADGAAAVPLFERSVAGMIIHFNAQNRPHEEGGGYFPNPVGAHEELLTSADGSAIYRVDLGTYQVTRLDATGRTLWSRQIAFTPRPFTTRIRDAVVTDLSGRMESHATGLGWASVAALRESIDGAVPKVSHLPPLTQAVVGAGDALWVRRELTDQPTTRWDVLDGAGVLVNSIQLPVGFTGRFAEGIHAIWGTVLDEFEVPAIVRFRVERAATVPGGTPPL